MTDDVRLARTFAAGELELGDGRTVVGRCVPYDEVAVVAGPESNGEPYREVWRAGSFRRVVRAADRTEFRYEHREGMLDLIGRARELDDRPDGLWGEFPVVGGPVGDHALELVRAGVLGGLSVLARVPARVRRLADGTVERTLATRLEHVALCGVPAYAGAGVTAIRAAAGVDDELATPELDAVRAWADERRLRSRPNG